VIRQIGVHRIEQKMIPRQEIYVKSLITGACSHGRVNDLYVESIYQSQSGPTFLSNKCESWEDFEAEKCSTNVDQLQMGEALSLNKYIPTIQLR